MKALVLSAPRRLNPIKMPTSTLIGMVTVSAVGSARKISCARLGSGALLPTAAHGLAPEPQVQDSVAAGADLICFSGDKLLGGPQAGIIVGKAAWVERLRRHPLARALRGPGQSSWIIDESITIIPPEPPPPPPVLPLPRPPWPPAPDALIPPSM